MVIDLIGSGDGRLSAILELQVHGGATRQDGVGIQVFLDVKIALHDGVVGDLIGSSGFHAHEERLGWRQW